MESALQVQILDDANCVLNRKVINQSVLPQTSNKWTVGQAGLFSLDRESPCCVLASMLDIDIVVSEFEL